MSEFRKLGYGLAPGAFWILGAVFEEGGWKDGKAQVHI